MIKTVSLSCCKIIQNASVNKKKSLNIYWNEKIIFDSWLRIERWIWDKGKIQCMYFYFLIYSVIVNVKKMPNPISV